MVNPEKTEKNKKPPTEIQWEQELIDDVGILPDERKKEIREIVKIMIRTQKESDPK